MEKIINLNFDKTFINLWLYTINVENFIQIFEFIISKNMINFLTEFFRSIDLIGCQILSTKFETFDKFYDEISENYEEDLINKQKKKEKFFKGLFGLLDENSFIKTSTKGKITFKEFCYNRLMKNLSELQFKI